jgi:hypothetical protein
VAVERGQLDALDVIGAERAPMRQRIRWLIAAVTAAGAAIVVSVIMHVANQHGSGKAPHNHFESQFPANPLVTSGSESNEGRGRAAYATVLSNLTASQITVHLVPPRSAGSGLRVALLPYTAWGRALDDQVGSGPSGVPQPPVALPRAGDAVLAIWMTCDTVPPAAIQLRLTNGTASAVQVLRTLPTEARDRPMAGVLRQLQRRACPG